MASIDDINGEELMEPLDPLNDEDGRFEFGKGQIVTFTGNAGLQNLGTARIIGIDKNGDDFRILLDDISSVKENAGAIHGITLNSASGTADTIRLRRSNGSVVFVESTQPRIYPLRESIVAKTVTPTIYYTYKDYTQTSALSDQGGGAFRMTVPSTVAGSGNDFVQGDSGVAAAYNITRNHWIDLDNITLAINGSNELEITFPDSASGNDVVAATDDIYVVVKIENESGGHLTKSLATSAVINYTWTSASDGNVDLTQEDVYRIVSIEQTSNGSKTFTDEEIREIFRLDTGARDHYYDSGKIDGFNDEILNDYKTVNTADTDYEIVVEFFNHTGGSNANYFSVDSYDTTFTSDLSKIPQFTASSGERFDLINCIDFRRKISDIEGASDIAYPEPFTDFNCTYEHFVSRVDKIYATEEGDIAAVSYTHLTLPTTPYV